MPYSGRKAPAARGIPTALYANAQPKFCRIFAKAARPSSNASAEAAISFFSETKTTPEAAAAASRPPEAAIPTSAVTNPGASLMPSPIMATVFPELFNFSMMAALSLGERLPRADAKRGVALSSRTAALTAAWRSPDKTCTSQFNSFLNL